MAFSLYSGTFSNGESIRLHMKSRLTSHDRCSWSRAYVNGNLVVRMSSRKWNFRYLKVLKPHQFCKGFGSGRSNIFSVGTDNSSSSYGIKTIIAEVKRKVAFREGSSLVFWKEWSYVKSAAILMTLTLLIIPKADAVDALKVCTCLLRECRLELSKCIANPSCAANIACLSKCIANPFYELTSGN